MSLPSPLARGWAWGYFNLSSMVEITLQSFPGWLVEGHVILPLLPLRPLGYLMRSPAPPSGHAMRKLEPHGGVTRRRPSLQPQLSPAPSHPSLGTRRVSGKAPEGSVPGCPDLPS